MRMQKGVLVFLKMWAFVSGEERAQILVGCAEWPLSL